MSTSLSQGSEQNKPSLPGLSSSRVTPHAEHVESNKAPTAFRTISEVATSLDVPQHVLRFWESKFQQVRPLKRGGGRRYYRPEDVTLLSNIKELLYTQGMTIRGVQKMLREGGRPQFARAPAHVGEAAPAVSANAARGFPAEKTSRNRRYFG